MRYLTSADLESRPDILDTASDLDLLLFAQQGVAGTAQLLLTMTRSALRNKLRVGAWREVHPGVVVAHTGPIIPEQRLWIAAISAGRGHPAPLGGRSALGVLGMRGFPSEQIDVVVAANRRLRLPVGVRAHRVVSFPPCDLAVGSRPPCTTAARAVVDAASWARSDREAITVVAMAFQQRLVTLAELRDVLRHLRRAKRRRLVWTTAVDAAAGAHALGELELLQLIRGAGLPLPTMQMVRRDAAGRRRYLDMYWPEFGVHVEVDGSHHLDVRQAWQDAERQNEVWIEGDRVLRFLAWAVRHEPARVLAQLQAALVAAGWRP